MPQYSNKRPKTGSIHHLKIISKITDEIIGWCIVKVIRPGKFRLKKSSNGLILSEKYTSNSVKSAGRYIFKDEIKNHRRKHKIWDQAVVKIIAS